MKNYELKKIGELRLDDRVLSAELSNYLDKTVSNILTTDLIIQNANLKILSGNYFQSNAASDGVKNFSYKNSFLQAESVFEVEGKHKDWGIACTGSKGYCMLSVMPDLNAVRLSGDLSLIEDTMLCGLAWSWSFGSNGDSEALHIDSIRQIEDAGICAVVFKEALPKSISDASVSSVEEMLYAFDHDDNAIYCPRHPELGNLAVHNFYGNHAEGGSVKAVGKYTHAEGRNTVADMRYSHAEGDSTFAGKMASHAEGQQTTAKGHYSHAEGKLTQASGEASHAEGFQTKASQSYAHAEGQTTEAQGQGSHAEGGQTSAFGEYSHASGYKSNAQKNRQFVWNGEETEYYSQGNAGSFSINPVSGISGFYIGTSSLNDYISYEANRGLNAVKSALSDLFIDDTDKVSSNIGFSNVIKCMYNLYMALSGIN